MKKLVLQIKLVRKNPSRFFSFCLVNRRLDFWSFLKSKLLPNVQTSVIFLTAIHYSEIDPTINELMIYVVFLSALYVILTSDVVQIEIPYILCDFLELKNIWK